VGDGGEDDLKRVMVYRMMAARARMVIAKIMKLITFIMSTSFQRILII
jgi:hypothetical protein